nr:PREDICTED: uncharacterized protein LOC106704386 [Latimeria chalumnae]|eukprot:XP_014346763.1 PREDICTED: uncharacterized protein LOC106704386 [Latimeria chalumnae]
MGSSQSMQTKPYTEQQWDKSRRTAWGSETAKMKKKPLLAINCCSCVWFAPVTGFCSTHEKERTAGTKKRQLEPLKVKERGKSSGLGVIEDKELVQILQQQKNSITHEPWNILSSASSETGSAEKQELPVSGLENLKMRYEQIKKSSFKMPKPSKKRNRVDCLPCKLEFDDSKLRNPSDQLTLLSQYRRSMCSRTATASLSFFCIQPNWHPPGMTIPTYEEDKLGAKGDNKETEILDAMSLISCEEYDLL